jgi:oligopeptidase A
MYTYQWSKVLAADMFSAFEENGGLFNESKVQATGRRFADTILALGGGRAPGSITHVPRSA